MGKTAEEFANEIPCIPSQYPMIVQALKEYAAQEAKPLVAALEDYACAMPPTNKNNYGSCCRMRILLTTFNERNHDPRS